MNEDEAGHRPDRTDLIAGAAMFALCTGFVWQANRYGIGTPARMGAGFFPFWFGLIGMAIAGAVMARNLIAPSVATGETPRLRPLLFVALGVIAFGLMIRPTGLAPAVFVSTLITAFADREATIPASLALAAGLSVGIWIIFVKLLGLPIPFIAGLF